MKKRSELFFRVLLIPTDYLMIVVSFALAYIVRIEQSKPLAYSIGGSMYLRNILPVLGLWIIIYAFSGLYELKITRSRLAEVTRIFTASALGVVVLIILDFFTIDFVFPSKAIPVYGFVFAVVLVSLSRLILYYIQRFLFRFGVGTYNTVIVGKGSSRIAFEKALLQESRIYTVAQNIAYSRKDTTRELKQANKQFRLDDMFIIEESLEKDSLLDLIEFSRMHQIQIHIVPSVSELYSAPTRMNRIQNIPVLEVLVTPLEGWARILKRIVDLGLVLISSIVFVPLMLVIALAIKLTDPGKVFYRHERLTRSGKKIQLLKFRTMKQAYCTGGEYSGKSDLEVLASFNDPKLIEEFERDQKVKNDPRISSVGKFLRATSLDELPQVWNILVGELSLVGPRPVVASELKKYGDESGIFLHIKPGLTGLWQVSGRNELSYDNRVKLDIYYIENWSIGLDLTILIRTIPVVFGKKGY